MKLGTAAVPADQGCGNVMLDFGVRACDACPTSKGCQHWLARAAIALDKALPHCPNADRFAQLLSEELAVGRQDANGIQMPIPAPWIGGAIDPSAASTLGPDDGEIVRRINAFRGVSPAVIKRLIAPARAISFYEGEVVFRQGEPATAFFILVEGWVKLYHITLGGDVAVIDIFAKGESLSEAAAIGGQVHLATAEAASPARLVRIPAEHVVKCIRSAPDLGLAMIASASQRVGQLVQQLVHLKAKTGLQRVAEFLASFCSAHDGTCVISLPYDKALIAGRLGLTPEYLSRVLAKLRSIGVEVHASDVVVHDVGRLLQLASGDRAAIRAFLREP